MHHMRVLPQKMVGAITPRSRLRRPGDGEKTSSEVVRLPASSLCDLQVVSSDCTLPHNEEIKAQVR
jgi:hypothetical protein